MAFKSGICWSCHNRRPVESHHMHPLEYGGKDDGPQVPLCADCHNILHKEGEYYYKNGKFHELDSTIPFESGGFGERIRQLIAYLVKAKAAYTAGHIDAGEQRRMTQISWDNDQELLIAHAVKRAMGFKSLERAIKKLVFDKWMNLQ